MYLNPKAPHESPNPHKLETQDSLLLVKSYDVGAMSFWVLGFSFLTECQLQVQGFNMAYYAVF